VAAAPPPPPTPAPPPPVAPSPPPAPPPVEVAAKAAPANPPAEPEAEAEKAAEEQPSEATEAKDDQGNSDDKEKGGEKTRRPTVAVTIKSDPQGSRVATGRHVFGTTPLTLKLRPGNTYELTFTKPGYNPISRKVRLEKDEPQSVRVTLKKLPEPPPKPAPQPKGPPPPPKKSSWFGR
jgi:hypothetical protein